MFLRYLLVSGEYVISFTTCVLSICLVLYDNTICCKYLDSLVYLLPKTISIMCLSNRLIMVVPDEGYSRNLSCTLNYISTFGSE